MVANREVRIEMSHSNRLQSVILLAIINISLVTSKKQLVILPLKKNHFIISVRWNCSWMCDAFKNSSRATFDAGVLNNFDSGIDSRVLSSFKILSSSCSRKLLMHLVLLTTPIYKHMFLNEIHRLNETSQFNVAQFTNFSRYKKNSI